MFLSGFFFPIAAMPKLLQYVSYAIPLRYFLIIARSIVLKGVGAEALVSEIVALIDLRRAHHLAGGLALPQDAGLTVTRTTGRPPRLDSMHHLQGWRR